MYDPGLESKANSVAKNCQDDQAFNGAGMNVGKTQGWSSASQALASAISEWSNQITNYKSNGRVSYSESSSAFTQMAWATAKKVGCAVQQCRNGHSIGNGNYNNYMLTVCMYDAGNSGGELYKSGEPCTSCNGYGCTAGLCSFNNRQ